MGIPRERPFPSRTAGLLPPDAKGTGTVAVDPQGLAGPAEQVRSQLTALIQSGELAANTRLPPVRQLAGDLRVAVSTVAKAYKELADAGLVRTGRADGTRVKSGQGLTQPALADAQVFVQAARKAGLNLEQAQGLLAVGWERVDP